MTGRTAAFILTLAVAATSALLAAAPPSGSRASAQEALRDWQSSCGYCHGRPGGAPELRGRRLPPDAIIVIARKGAPGMPAFHRSELDDARLAGLARWISRQPASKAVK